MPNEKNLPVKVILPRQGDTQVPKTTGGSPKPISEVTEGLRETLKTAVQGLGHARQEWFEQHPDIPVVGKVQLVDKALSKTHRPRTLFSD